MNISNFLKENNGNESSMRLLVAFIVVAVMGTWSYVSVKTSVMAPLDLPTVLTIVGSLLAKAWQKEKESGNAPNPPVV